jgi:hypothetical protein
MCSHQIPARRPTSGTQLVVGRKDNQDVLSSHFDGYGVFFDSVLKF